MAAPVAKAEEAALVAGAPVSTLGPSDPPSGSGVSGAGDAIWARQNPRPAASVGVGFGFFAGSAAGQSDTMVRGSLALRVAPVKYLDIGLSFLYGYNTSPPPGVNLGFDFFPTVRAGFDLGRLSVGGAVLVRIRSGIDRPGPDLAGTGFALRALGDYRVLDALALHLNLGFVSDNSAHLTSASVSEAYRFATELSTASLLLSFVVGADYDVTRWLKPFLTAQFDVPVAGAGAGAGQKRIVPGARLVPLKGLAIDAQVAFGFGGDAGVPPPPLYQVTLLASYSFWPGLKETVVVEGPSISGRITRKGDGTPIEGAVVTTDDPAVHGAATNARGEFRLSGVRAGEERRLRVSLRGYAPGEGRAVPGGPDAAIALERRAEAGSVTGVITDLEGKPIPQASVSIRSPATRKVVKVIADEAGKYEALVQPDTYHLTLEAQGFLSLGRKIAFGDGAAVVFDAALRPRPDVAAASLEEGRITVAQRINFATGTDELDLDSQLVLEEVASILLLHEEVELLEVGGHTDERGSDETNRDLSERRAKRVVEHLINRGVEQARLAAKGLGKTQPIGSNKTEAGRAQNRRVEFLIKTKPEGAK
ncbi:MAG: hypothetical protein EXR72_24315 [Myxococcales bacterium]|nr:hypothetical protein [Myxococcales bacterium]